jgi:hypothetical protein
MTLCARDEGARMGLESSRAGGEERCRCCCDEVLSLHDWFGSRRQTCQVPVYVKCESLSLPTSKTRPQKQHCATY